MVIAIDFDDTIAEAVQPYNGEVGTIIRDAKKYINRLYGEGHYIIIWTCRGDISLVNMINWLDEQGINYHKVNENAYMKIIGFKPSPKIYYDLLIDDKILGGLPSWKEIYEIINDTN